MPALLPDGTQSRLSVSGVLAAQAAEVRAPGRRPIAGEALPEPQPGGTGQGTPSSSAPIPADDQEDER
jgi:hypothetical protein